MIINGYEVTSNFFDYVDPTMCHLELDYCIRLVHLSQTEYKTMQELQTAVEALIFPKR
jgi:inhibitor of KinA sporulation pathway (predicted exonuclease)